MTGSDSIMGSDSNDGVRVEIIVLHNRTSSHYAVSDPIRGPARRVRSGARVRSESSSRMPRLIVEREIPVARSTKPLRPCAIASLAAHTRRERSANTGRTTRYVCRSVVRFMNASEARLPHKSISYLFPIPKP